jgi:hypothetical protein
MNGFLIGTSVWLLLAGEKVGTDDGPRRYGAVLGFTKTVDSSGLLRISGMLQLGDEPSSLVDVFTIYATINTFTDGMLGDTILRSKLGVLIASNANHHTDHPFATEFRLPPGTYKVKVAATEPGGTKDENGKPIPFDAVSQTSTVTIP